MDLRLARSTDGRTDRDARATVARQLAIERNTDGRQKGEEEAAAAAAEWARQEYLIATGT